MGGKPFDTSGKAGQDENETGDETPRQDEERDGIGEANEATGNGAEDLTELGTRQAGSRDK